MGRRGEEVGLSSNRVRAFKEGLLVLLGTRSLVARAALRQARIAAPRLTVDAQLKRLQSYRRCIEALKGEGGSQNAA